MSKKTRARRGAPARRSPSPASGRGGQGTLYDNMLSSMWAGIASGDPLRAELEVATCMALPRVGQLDPDKAEDFSAKVLVNEAVERWGADGTALLRLLMSLGPPRVKRTAGAALAEMTKAGIYPPDWVNQVGKAVPVQARRRYDAFGDEEAVVVTFRYGEAEHGVIVQVDLTGMPVATDIAVSQNGAGLLDAVSDVEHSSDRVEPIGLAEARRRLEDPLARCDEDPVAELSVQTLACLPIARSRVRRLPGAATAEAPREFTAADRAAAVDEFMKSPLAAHAVAADEEATRFWAEVLASYNTRVPGAPPAQIGPVRLTRILLAHVPLTVAVSPAQRGHLEPAVTAWIRWSAGYRELDEAATARLAEALDRALAGFDEAYHAPENVAARGAFLASGIGGSPAAR
jgi:hypothetical protein